MILLATSLLLAVTRIADIRPALERSGKTVEFFEVEGRITAQIGNRFICQDDSGRCIISPFKVSGWTPGDHVRINCRANIQKYGVYDYLLEAPTVKVLSHGPAEEPRRIKPAELNERDLAFRAVRLEGLVTEAYRDEIDPQWNVLVLEDRSATAVVLLQDPDLTQAQLNQLIDSTVSVEGICLHYNNGARRYLDVHVQAHSRDAIRILEPAPADPFDVDELDDRSTLHAADPWQFPHRRKASGTVIATWDGNRLFLKTRLGRVLEIALQAGTPLPKPGDSITVSGRITSNLYFLKFENALFRQCADSPAPTDAPPVDTSRKRILFAANGEAQVDFTLNGQLVRINGTVRNSYDEGCKNGHLDLESDGGIVTVWTGAAHHPPLGSQVNVTGVCILTGDASGAIFRLTGFSLAIRSADDIQITVPPPWWTPRKFMAAIALLLSVIVGFVVKNRMVRLRADLRVEERTRLATDLHDALSQNLAGISLQLDAAELLSATNREKMLSHLSIASKTLQSCRDELRNCLWDLRSHTLEKRSMNEAIAMTLKPHIGNAALSIRFSVPRARLSDNLAHALLKIIRELASNAVRHGAAGAIRVAGATEENRILFSVTDNGTGFDPGNCPGIAEGHFGIQGIRERVRSLGGTVEFKSEPGKGTKVTIRI